jgi:septal ring factor EnvC (AmiA/AmiB activator)
MPPNAYTPLWALTAAAAIITLCGAAYAIVKLWYHILDKQLEHKKKKRVNEQNDEADDRRTSAKEAWDTVDKVTAELESVGPRMTALEKRCQEAELRAARCEADHMGTKRVLRIVTAWGKSKGMKLPPEIEEELSGGDGSDLHRSYVPPQTPNPRTGD